MNTIALNGFIAATKELTMYEKFISSAKVILTGFVVVFIVLILLILIIKFFGFAISSVQQRANKKLSEKVKKEENVVTIPSDGALMPVSDNNGVSGEVVAVISAAVAAMYGSSEKVRIKSIKKSDGSRSAWANAGVLNNTRPF